MGLALLVASLGGATALSKKKKGKKKAQNPPTLSQNKNSQQLVYPQRTTKVSQCANKRIVSGGFSLNTKAGATSPFSFPDGMGPPAGKTNSWSATAHNRSAIYPDVISTYAYCYPKSRVSVVKRASKQIGSEEGSVGVGCPKGKVLIGGGWRTDAVPSAVDTSVDNHGEVILTGLRRLLNSQTLQVSVYNEKITGVELTAIAVCGAGPKPVEVEKIIAVEERTSGGEGATATCPGKKKVVFGGFVGDYLYGGDFEDGHATFLTKLYRSAPNKVYGFAFNPPIGFVPTTSHMAVIAYCR